MISAADFGNCLRLARGVKVYRQGELGFRGVGLSQAVLPNVGK